MITNWSQIFVFKEGPRVRNSRFWATQWQLMTIDMAMAKYRSWCTSPRSQHPPSSLYTGNMESFSVHSFFCELVTMRFFFFHQTERLVVQLQATRQEMSAPPPPPLMYREADDWPHEFDKSKNRSTFFKRASNFCDKDKCSERYGNEEGLHEKNFCHWGRPWQLVSPAAQRWRIFDFDQSVRR